MFERGQNFVKKSPGAGAEEGIKEKVSFPE